MSNLCACSVPPGRTYSHCRSCCASYQTLDLWDAHRDGGRCYDLEGVELDDHGVWDTPDNIQRRAIFRERVSPVGFEPTT